MATLAGLRFEGVVGDRQRKPGEDDQGDRRVTQNGENGDFERDVFRFFERFPDGEPSFDRNENDGIATGGSKE